MKTLFRFFLIVSFILPLTAIAAFASSEIPVYTEQKTSFIITPEQPEFIIKLKSNPTTGYSWFLREYHSRYLEPIKHRFLRPENSKMIMGAPGYELWTFKVKPAAFVVPLRTSFVFNYLRPWEKRDPITKLVFWISTKGR